VKKLWPALLLCGLLTSCLNQKNEGGQGGDKDGRGGNGVEVNVDPNAVHIEPDAAHFEVKEGAATGRVDVQAPVTVADGAVRIDGKMTVAPSTTFAPSAQVDVYEKAFSAAEGAVQFKGAPDMVHLEWKPQGQLYVGPGAVQVKAEVPLGRAELALAVFLYTLSAAALMWGVSRILRRDAK